MSDTKQVDVNLPLVTKAYFLGKPTFITEAQPLCKKRISTNSIPQK